MIDRSPCINQDALVTYVYDECEASERDSIAAHVAGCAACTEEVRALRDTRAHLGAWVPPSMPLGFQITRTEAEAPATVLGPAARVRRSPSGGGGWWRQPLPAWAQAAAAMVVFAAGVSFGSGRAASLPPQQTSVAPRAAVAVQPVADSTTSRELSRLEQRLRALEAAQARGVPAQAARAAAPLDRIVRAATTFDDAALVARMRAMVDERIAESELRQREDNVRILEGIVRHVDAFGGTTERVASLEERVEEAEQAVRIMAGGTSLVRLTSLATAP